jgi:uncharacterized protein (TIGR02757 family)
MAQRVVFDPVKFPHRFTNQEDIEVAALVASSLAYGRADMFLSVLESIFEKMGKHPARFAVELDPKNSLEWEKIRYRFNTGIDIAALVYSAGRILEQYGVLGRAFEQWHQQTGGVRAALAMLVNTLRINAMPVLKMLSKTTQGGFEHLLPNPIKGGACKRLLLFLRWMVRGGKNEPVDFGIWRAISPSELVIPLDTHVSRISWSLGLTKRKDVRWETAVQITESLRLLDQEDPVRFDFALCHHGMSGACPSKRNPNICVRCSLSAECVLF